MAERLHTRVSVNQLCFPGALPARCIELAATMGASTVTLCSPQLLDPEGLAQARAARRACDVNVACVSHTFAVHPDLEQDQGGATDALLALVEAAHAIDAPAIYLLTGGRGRLDWESAADRFVELLAPCREAAGQAGISLLVENASPLFADIHIAHSLADAIQLADHARLGLCTDLFYCWAEANLDVNLARAATRSGLVQVADYLLGDRSLPARAVPGDGAIPLERLIRVLVEGGYGGVFDLELLGPRIDAEGHVGATRRSARWLSAILEQTGA